VDSVQSALSPVDPGVSLTATLDGFGKTYGISHTQDRNTNALRLLSACFHCSNIVGRRCITDVQLRNGHFLDIRRCKSVDSTGNSSAATFRDVSLRAYHLLVSGMAVAQCKRDLSMRSIGMPCDTHATFDSVFQRHRSLRLERAEWRRRAPSCRRKNPPWAETGARSMRECLPPQKGARLWTFARSARTPLGGRLPMPSHQE
jgi:hypothetical protein